MDSQALSEWLDSLPLSEKISALSLIYSSLTVSTRELFLPNRTAGKEEFVLRALQGLNEMHHALASQLLSYSKVALSLPLRVRPHSLPTRWEAPRRST